MTKTLNPEALETLIDRVQKEVSEGLLPSVQIAIAHQGELKYFETFGDTTVPGNEALYSIFSATKAITSAAAWLLIEAGELDISLPVIHYIPEFGANGKEAITVEQLFLHTAGFPHAPFRPPQWFSQQERLDRFASWTLNWAPGSRYEYHPTSSMWVIAELIERCSGQSYSDFIQSRIAQPLGLDEFYIGAPHEVQHRIQDVCCVGDALTEDDYKAMGLPVPPVTEVTEDVLLNFNNPEIREVPIAGGGGHMSAASLALFYQGFLSGQSNSGQTIWQADTLAMGRKVRSGDYRDPLMGHRVNRALGLVISGDEDRNKRGYGYTHGPNAFGHSGAGGQIAWADPDTGLSFVYLTSGHDRNTVREARRVVSVNNKAAVLTSRQDS